MNGKKACRIYLIRHGETTNASEVCFNGHYDVDLSKNGLKQSLCIAEALKIAPIKAVYSSDLKRTQIVQYAGASGDYNPLHTDEIFTTQIAGYPSVFAHGMLSMGLTGTMLTDYVGDGTLMKYGVRFTNQVWPGDTLKSTATIVDIRDQDGERVVDLEVVTTNQNEVPVVTGNATAKIES